MGHLWNVNEKNTAEIDKKLNIETVGRFGTLTYQRSHYEHIKWECSIYLVQLFPLHNASICLAAFIQQLLYDILAFDPEEVILSPIIMKIVISLPWLQEMQNQDKDLCTIS